MKKIILVLIGISFFQIVVAQKFEDLDLYHLDFSVGVHSSFLRNKTLDNYISTYNKNNASVLKSDFNNFRMLNGFEVGIKWNYLSMNYGQHSQSQWREISNNVERQFRLNGSYVNVLGTFEIGKSKTRISMGLNSYSSKFIAQVKYPNGEKSRGQDYNLNGTYKGKSLNGSIRVEKRLGKREKNFPSFFVQFTGLIKGTDSGYTDFNSGKAALNTGNNAITSIDAKAGFTGFFFGLNFNFGTSKNTR